MKHSGLSRVVSIIILLALILATGVSANEPVSFIGKLFDEGQIIAEDGEIYEIGPTDKGIELEDSNIIDMLLITGILKKKGNKVLIDIIDYEAIEK